MQTYIKFLALFFALSFNYAFSTPKIVAPVETLTIPFYSEVLNIQYPLAIKQKFTKNLQKFAKKKAKISPKIRPKRVLKKSGPCCEWVNEVFFRVKRNQILKISLRRVEGEIEI